MVPVIGTGKFLTSPLIDDDELPIDQSLIGVPISDKKTLRWMQTLHQIGMNDICSPMVILLDNEADSFFCFERAMRRMRENFRTSASSMGVQSTLSQIMKTFDPQLHQHLEDLDAREYLFPFHMLMVLFRREFSFVDTLYLWELMWAMEYDPNIFSLYEESEVARTVDTTRAINDKLWKKYGKFQRKNLQAGNTEEQLSALSVFLVANVLEIKIRRILKEAKGVDA